MEGQEISLEPSQGRLAVRKLILHGDGVQYERLAFEGALDLRGEAPTGFVVDAAVAGRAALGFRHEFVQDSRILLWIYGSGMIPGSRAADWDSWLEERMKRLPKPYEAVVVRAFADGGGASPLLGGTPMVTEWEIRNRKTEERYRQRLLVRHLEEKEKVLVVDLFCPEAHYGTFREAMRVFGVDLYFPEES